MVKFSLSELLVQGDPVTLNTSRAEQMKKIKNSIISQNAFLLNIISFSIVNDKSSFCVL